MSPEISDRGLAVFAFAIYHQLESGERVTHVIKSDNAGHQADSGAVSELQKLHIVDADGDRVRFTPRGIAIVDSIIDNMRRAAESGITSG